MTQHLSLHILSNAGTFHIDAAREKKEWHSIQHQDWMLRNGTKRKGDICRKSWSIWQVQQDEDLRYSWIRSS
jgi:hypothetical protein